MWTTSDNIPEGAGTIEGIIVRARQKFNDVEMQAKYIKIAVDLLRRDQGDTVGTFNFVYSGYEGVLTMFPSGGDIFAHWELYESGALEASGVEKYSPSTEQFRVLFTTSSEFSEQSITELYYGKICK